MSDCPDISAFSPEEVFDLKGNTLLPGFIDAHCHMGLAEEGLNFEGDDLNEITDPVTPQPVSYTHLTLPAWRVQSCR